MLESLPHWSLHEINSCHLQPMHHDCRHRYFPRYHHARYCGCRHYYRHCQFVHYYCLDEMEC